MALSKCLCAYLVHRDLYEAVGLRAALAHSRGRSAVQHCDVRLFVCNRTHKHTETVSQVAHDELWYGGAVAYWPLCAAPAPFCPRQTALRT
eukprot:COSAG06_NODE_18366_length_891_cov_0.914141_1_plen_91_part_00